MGEPEGEKKTKKDSGFFDKRDDRRVPERARVQIAHVLAANSIEDVELTVDCPGCGQCILVDVERLGGALGLCGEANEMRRAEPAREQSDVRERHISSVMRTDAPSVSVETAIGMLPDVFEQSGASVVVLVDADGRPQGVVSPLDLFREVGTHGPTSIAGLGLADVAKTRALYLRTDTRVSSALRVFAEHEPECIVAVSDSGKLAGIVTPSDLLRFLTS